jgi:hypothetical protein
MKEIDFSAFFKEYYDNELLEDEMYANIKELEEIFFVSGLGFISGFRFVSEFRCFCGGRWLCRFVISRIAC